MFTLRPDRAMMGTVFDKLEDKNVRRAFAWALTDTAQDALKHMQARMDQVFDRPTRFTRNAFMVWGAKPASLEAMVQERPSMGPRHYLKVQEAGGARPQTGLEKLMASRIAFDGILRTVIPADEARLDASGNWSAGQRNQVLSALGAQSDRAANTTERSRKRAKKRLSYFVPRQGLTPGIYSRDADGNIGIVAIFTDAVPVYTKRLGFYDGVDEVFQANFAENLRRTLAKVGVAGGAA